MGNQATVVMAEYTITVKYFIMSTINGQKHYTIYSKIFKRENFRSFSFIFPHIMALSICNIAYKHATVKFSSE